MPNTRSARKWMRKDVKRKLRNRSIKSTLKSLIKRFKETVAGGDQVAIKGLLSELFKRFDQAAAKKIIHKNKASRIKSRAVAYVRRKTAPTTAN